MLLKLVRFTPIILLGLLVITNITNSAQDDFNPKAFIHPIKKTHLEKLEEYWSCSICGEGISNLALLFENFDDIKAGDSIEAFEMVEEIRKMV